MAQSRRFFLGGLLALAIAAVAPPAFADGGGGDDGGGDDNGGGDNSGPGNNNDNDDGDDDPDDDEGGKNERNPTREQERALKARKNGKVVSLQVLQKHLKEKYPGKILKVGLRKTLGTYYYDVRILAPGNRIKSWTLHALTLQPKAD